MSSGSASCPTRRWGRGFLSGKIRSFEDLEPGDFRRSSPRFQGENFAKNLELLDRTVQIAHDKGVTPSQLALAWVLAQGDDVVPIPGTRRIANLQENAAALDVVLTEQDLAAIEQVAPRGAAAGERYAPAGMAMLNH